MNENPELCTECRGHCCKAMPGCMRPEDVKRHEGESLMGAVERLLASGDYAVDWWDGDPLDRDDDDPSRVVNAYYLRPATVDKRWHRRDPSRGGTCVFLSSDGCTLAPEDRPAQCKGLVPGTPYPRGCKQTLLSKQDAAIAWLPYNEILEEASSR